MASSSAVAPDPRPRRTRVVSALPDRGSSRNNVDRESNGVGSPRSRGSRSSPDEDDQPVLHRRSSALLLCLVEAVDLVDEQDRPLLVLAEALCAPRSPRTSFTDVLTADSGKNARRRALAISRASVVLPVPGGPQKIPTTAGRPRSAAGAASLAEQVPPASTTSSSRAGRRRRQRRLALEAFAAAARTGHLTRGSTSSARRHLLVGLLAGVAREVREEDEVLQRQRVFEELDALGHLLRVSPNPCLLTERARAWG